MTETRPQDDLFRAVNADWLATTDIPDDRAGVNVFVELSDRAEEAVRDLIAAADGALGSDERKVADMFASFTNTDTIAELGRTPLDQVVERIDAITTIEDFARILGEFHRLGIGSLIGTDVDADPGNPTHEVLFVGQSGLGLPDEEFYRLPEHAEIRGAYQAHIAAMLSLAGAPDADHQARAVFDLETEIAAHHWDKVRCRDIRQMYNPMTLDELTTQAPSIMWTEFLAGLGVERRRDIGTVVNSQPSFFTDIADLMTDDHLPAWRAWARWRAASSMASYLTDDFVNENFHFYGTVVNGTPQLRERWKRAIKVTESVLGEAVGKLYVGHYFPPQAKDRVNVMVDNLLRAYRESISNLDWMGEDTRAEALTKLANFTPKVGYPNQWIDYSALQITANDLVGNIQRSAAFEVDRAIAKINQPIQRHEWLMPPQTVNAYYHPLRNEIVFPAAICQPPFFDADGDDAANYGALGAVIGHEIGHGFDDQGSTCDGQGRLRDWWTAEDRAAFEERTKTLISQYATLSPEGADGATVNGELTIGENIGDLGGLSIAYRAWLLTEPDTADGSARRFFESWARAWRGKERPESVKQRLAVDPHSPNEFRCNQVVRNIDAFHDAFSTTADDGEWLAPDDRVSIW